MGGFPNEKQTTIAQRTPESRPARSIRTDLAPEEARCRRQSPIGLHSRSDHGDDAGRTGASEASRMDGDNKTEETMKMAEDPRISNHAAQLANQLELLQAMAATLASHYAKVVELEAAVKRLDRELGDHRELITKIRRKVFPDAETQAPAVTSEPVN